jgi:hypothetical protein
MTVFRRPGGVIGAAISYIKELYVNYICILAGGREEALVVYVAI